MYVPINWLPGLARLIYVNKLSSDPMVTFVMTVESKVDRVTVYGFSPPCMVRPQGWHVAIVVVTLGVMDGVDEEPVVGRHEVLVPATLALQQREKGLSLQLVPFTVYSVDGTPPVLLFESIIVSISTEPISQVSTSGCLIQRAI